MINQKKTRAGLELLSKTLKFPLSNNLPQTNETVEDTFLDPVDIVKRLSQLRPVIIVTSATQKSQDKTKFRNALYIQDSEVVARLESLCGQGLVHLRLFNISECLLTLKQADLIINSSANLECILPWKIYMAVQVNLGICYYKIGLLDQALNQFESYNLIQKRARRINVNKYRLVGYKRTVVSQKRKYLSNVLYNVASYFPNQEGIKKRLASEGHLLERLLTQLQSFMNFLLNYRAKSLLAPHSWNGMIRKIQRIIEQSKKNDMMNSQFLVFGRARLSLQGNKLIVGQQSKYSLFSPNKTNIFRGYSIKGFELSSNEVNASNLITIIGCLTVSYYCVSTEARFKEGNEKLPNSSFKDSENYLSHSLEIAYLFLPHEMPVVGQIICVHNKFHGLSKQIIYEDKDGTLQQKGQQDDFDIIVLKPFKGQQKAPFFVPLIRKSKQVNHQDKNRQATQTQLSTHKQARSVNRTNLEISVHSQTKGLETDSDSLQPLQLFQEMRINTLNREQQPLLKIELPANFSTVERAKSAAKKVQTPTTLNNQQKRLQEIYSTIGKINSNPKKAVKTNQNNRNQFQIKNLGIQQLQLPNQTVQLQYPFEQITEIIQTKPVSVTNQGNDEPFFPASNTNSNQQSKLQQNFFEDFRNQKRNVDIQIQNNFNIMINNTISQTEVVKPRIAGRQYQLANLNLLQGDGLDPKQLKTQFFSGQGSSRAQQKNKQNIFITKKRSISQKSPQSKDQQIDLEQIQRIQKDR